MYCSDICGIDITGKSTSDHTLQRVGSHVLSISTIEMIQFSRAYVLDGWFNHQPEKHGEIAGSRRADCCHSPGLCCDSLSQMAKAGTTGEFTPKVVVCEVLGLLLMPQIISCLGNAPLFLGGVFGKDSSGMSSLHREEMIVTGCVSRTCICFPNPEVLDKTYGQQMLSFLWGPS